MEYYLQGYVCPGLLVVRGDREAVAVLEESWQQRAGLAPPGTNILRLGRHASPAAWSPANQAS